jgi:hypothetical protein
MISRSKRTRLLSLRATLLLGSEIPGSHLEKDE